MENENIMENENYDDQTANETFEIPLQTRKRGRKSIYLERRNNEQHNEENQPSVDEFEDPNKDRRKPGKRGRTQMKRVVKNKIKGVKETIEYNKRIQGIGEESARFQNYLGVLARALIPIKYKDWFEVPDHILENILVEATVSNFICIIIGIFFS